MNVVLSKLCKKAGLSKNAINQETTQLNAYRLLSFYGRRDCKPIDLYRSQVLVETHSVTPREISRRLQLVRNWLLDKRENGVGFLKYEYLP